MACARWPMGDGPAESDGGVGRRREVTAYHNALRIPSPVPGERSDDGMELPRNLVTKLPSKAMFGRSLYVLLGF